MNLLAGSQQREPHLLDWKWPLNVSGRIDVPARQAHDGRHFLLLQVTSSSTAVPCVSGRILTTTPSCTRSARVENTNNFLVVLSFVKSFMQPVDSHYCQLCAVWLLQSLLPATNPLILTLTALSNKSSRSILLRVHTCRKWLHVACFHSNHSLMLTGALPSIVGTWGHLDIFFATAVCVTCAACRHSGNPPLTSRCDSSWIPQQGY